MTHRTIHIRGWKVDVFIDDGGKTDIDGILYLLYGMGASFETMEKAEDIMLGVMPNEAFTFSVSRHTVIYIGWVTSAAEFVNSMVHEIRHLIDHIADYYGLSNGEAVGYMSGDAAFLLAEEICEHGCTHCNKTKELYDGM